MAAEMVATMMRKDATKTDGNNLVDEDARARLFFSKTRRELICQDAFYVGI